MLGVVALSQIKQTYQQGRGLAIAGIAVGSAVVALLVVAMIAYSQRRITSPMIGALILRYPVGGRNGSDWRCMPAARPFAAITRAILRLASSSISSPSITAPRAPPAAEVCHS